MPETQIITTGNVIYIGHAAADVSDTTWIRNVFGVTTKSGMTAPVVVSNNGQLGTIASSEPQNRDRLGEGSRKTSQACRKQAKQSWHSGQSHSTTGQTRGTHRNLV
jgi:hypothetical protein